MGAAEAAHRLGSGLMHTRSALAHVRRVLGGLGG
jgi:hypothetical protein